MTRILLFTGFSGSGKTYCIAKVIPCLRERGLKVGYVKHHHGSISPSQERGKDTWKILKSGAEKALLIANDAIVIEMINDQKGKTNIIDTYTQSLFTDHHLVIAEGFKEDKTHPKIIVVNDHTFKETQEWLDKRKWGKDIIAILTDLPFFHESLPCPALSPNDPKAICELIVNYFNL